MTLSRSRAAEFGRETVAILKAGVYTARNGMVVAVGEQVRRAVAGTVSYPHDEPVPRFDAASHNTRIEVTNESTLAVACRLVEAGQRPVALNFASAKHPGGGFLGGARAQEESLARASALYACINGNPMYARHQAAGDAMYTSSMIYSPEVPVFRNDEGELLEQPYLCAFITAPAVNAGAVLKNHRGRRDDIHREMERRVRKVLAIAAHHQHAALVLGAWGCGVFQNDSEAIAGLFRAALATEFHGVFRHVVFAILDWSSDHHFIGPFEQAFA
jgi:uncharacterized protein (TIGR02452 family)